MKTMQPISILLCALGGEGGGVLADWLVDVARLRDHPAQATSIPGVAQRTGATTYYIEIFAQPMSALQGKRPVLGLNPLPGRLDALVSSELLETARQIGNGLCSATHTQVITSSARILTTMEKMTLGDGRQDETALQQLVVAHSREHHIVDMARMTQEAGTVVSAVMLGCIAASGLLPFARSDFETVIGHGGKTAEASLRGFALGFAAIQAQRQQTAFVQAVLDTDTPSLRTASVPADVARLLPSAAHAMASLGHARVQQYQNAAYARLYVQRLQTLWDAESAAGGEGAVTQEAARWLALWMAYDDVVQVADLKSRRSRAARVRQEARAGTHDLLRIYDHFKPGMPELAGLLPEFLAARLLRWDRARVAAGKAPWAMPLKIGSHSIVGMLALRAMAHLKILRPFGSRHAAEQQAIAQWLQATAQACAQSPALALEVARCGRLIKGYGSTNERGKHNLQHILTHVLAPRQTPADQALALARVREAALQDEGGKALDQALRSHGAPARPLVAQPIRWMKNPRLQT